MKQYKGCVLKESLTNDKILNTLKIVKTRIDSEEGFHIYDVLVTKKEINELHNYLKEGWYMHFWKDDEMIVLFKGKKFILDMNNKKTWKPAVDYGLSIGIEEDLLVFEKEF